MPTQATDPSATAPRTDRIVDRLRAHAQQRFVGRAAELELLKRALDDGTRTTSLFLVHGPGGIGKTTLLERLRVLAPEAGYEVLRLDARDLEPTAEGVVRALASALGLEPGPHAQTLQALLTRWHTQPRRLLLVDTFETLAPLEAWLRDSLLAELPQQSVAVLAGRNPPGAAWTADPLWQAGTRVVELRNLEPEDGRRLLALRDIDAGLHEALQRLSYGHPLALTLLADVVQARGTVPERLDTDLIRRLTDRFAAQAPSLLHRRALEVCAHVRSTTQGLLARTVDAGQAHALFDWLSRLSFVQAGPHGLFPHDLVRDAISAELGWRDPQAKKDLAMQLRTLYLQDIREASGDERSRLALDILFLQRVSPLMRRFFDFEGIGSASFDRAREDEHEAAAALVEQQLGTGTRALMAHWRGHPAARLWVARSMGQQVIGVGLLLELDALSPQEIAADPGLAIAVDWVERQMPMRPGDMLLCSRFTAAEGGMRRAGPASNALQMCMVFHWLTEPRLAAFVNISDDPDYWRPVMDYIDFHEVEAPGLMLGGAPAGMFVHDFRAVSADRWMDLMALRAAHGADATEPAPAAAAERIVLAQGSFGLAVREALRTLGDAGALAANPLLRSRLVQAAQREGETAADTLRRLLDESLAGLATRPRDEKFRRALELTYFRPAPSQEQAAERLGLPFGTYRYQLGTGVTRLVEQLWRQETGQA